MKTELYSVIKSPYLTEKVSSLMGESNQYAFKVDINATKLQVKKAVEGYFSVNVEDVNIIKVKGKTKRSRYRIRKKSDWKKAYVRLADGQSIEVTSEYWLLKLKSLNLLLLEEDLDRGFQEMTCIKVILMLLF